GKGRVRLGGVDWAAASESGENIPDGEIVKVKEVRSSRLIVEAGLSDTKNSNKEN
ncbi:MAG: NfeD family protein, partial [Oscillospiraceae bacterium]|nr:NfeD family protein [Oscillospiraceae bacterium]